MSKFQEILSNIADSLSLKYGFEIDASDFKPELIFTYGEQDIPGKPGKKEGDAVGTGPTKKFWNSKYKVWLPKDLYNAMLSLSADSVSIKKMTKEDKEVLMNKLKDIKGDIDVSGFVSTLTDDFSKYFKVESEIESKIEEGRSKSKDNSDKSKKEISDLRSKSKEMEEILKKSLQKFVKEKSSQIESRNKSLQEIDKIFGSEIAQGVKKVILRKDKPSEISSSIEKSIPVGETQSYTPKFDKDKKEFTKKDIEWLANVLKSKYKEGVGGIIKEMAGKFNKDLIDDIEDAARKYKGVTGIGVFLKDYEEKKKDIEKYQKNTPNMQPGTNISEIRNALKPVENFINKAKSKLRLVGYDDSFMAYTEKVLDAIKAYSASNKKVPEFEFALIDILGGEESEKRSGLTNAWRDAKVPNISKLMTQLPKKLSDSFDFDSYEVSEKEFLDNPDKLYQRINKMEKKPSYLKDILELRKKPIKFEPFLIEDEEGNIEEDISRLNMNDQDFINQIKEVLKDDHKKMIEKIRDEGLSPEKIKERRKDFKDTVKDEKKEDLLKTISDQDVKQMEELEKKQEKSQEKVNQLRKELRDISKQDLGALTKEKKDLQDKIDETDDKEKKDKMFKKLKKIEESIQMSKGKGEEALKKIKEDLEKAEKDLTEQEYKRDSIKDMQKRFKDLDAWLKDIESKSKGKSEKEYKMVDVPKETKDEYLKNFQDAMIVYYLNKYPDILYETVDKGQVPTSKMKELQDLQKKVEEKKNKKDEEKLKKLKDEIEKMESTGKTRVPRSEADVLKEIEKLRKRLKEVYQNRAIITPKEYEKYVKDLKVKNDDMKEILNKADVDFKNLLQKDKLEKEDKVKNKESYVAEAYRNTLFYKLEKLASKSNDPFIQAELLVISEKLREIV